MRNYRPDDALEPSTFAVVLSQVFHEEPWEDIEPYAARAWSQLPTERRWEDIREEVAQAFAPKTDAAL